MFGEEGISRGPVAVMAYLVKYKEWTMEVDMYMYTPHLLPLQIALYHFVIVNRKHWSTSVNIDVMSDQ